MSPSSQPDRKGKPILCVFHPDDERDFHQVRDQLYALEDGFTFVGPVDYLGRPALQKSVVGVLALVTQKFLHSKQLIPLVSKLHDRGVPCTGLALDDVEKLPPFFEAFTIYRGMPLFKLPPVTRSETFKQVLRRILEMIGRPSKAPETQSAEDLPVPGDLVAALAAGQGVFFAGPGMSVIAGMPAAGDVVDKAMKWPALKGSIDFLLRDSLYSLVRQGKSDLALEGIVDGIERGSPAVVDFLKGVYSETLPKLTAAHTCLRDLNLSAVLTPNYDALLELALKIKPEDVRTVLDAERLLASLSKKEFFALKLYGTLERPETVLLTPSRYRDAVAGNVAFGQFLSSLFFSRTLLFAGTSLEKIEEFLGAIPSRGEQTPRHFALIPDSETGWQARVASLKRRFGLELVVIPRYDAGLGIFLGRVAQEVRRILKEQGTPVTGAIDEPDRLASVSVENIGPFESKTLELNGTWNLLLGDNGVGKSFILKAIAVAIIGEEAAPLAARLIRKGRTSASITLKTVRGETYRTEILASESGARVKTVPTRPLEKEGWLAIGFPPLRTVSWKSPQRYEPVERARAVAGDLLPLVQGEADPRLDGLKAWLLHLHHSINAPNQTANARPSLHQRLWDKFFDVVRKATPGMNLGQARVDAPRRQVLIETDDGEVPIEAVSQGTQSLMGWIGVVLQRLFEVYERDDDPTGRYALILMDEIDAHMHPYWQQMLVTNLREIFPKAQFVATSHSPLVVSGLSKDEVWIFKREGETKRPVRVERPLEDFKGWRVDQILTSRSFGLAGARDKKTTDLLAEYTELVSKFDLAPEKRKRLEELARELGATVPSPQSLPQAREASAMIEEAFKKKLEAMPAEDRRKLVQELRAQVQGVQKPS